MAGRTLKRRAAAAAVFSPSETIFRISDCCCGESLGRRPPTRPYLTGGIDSGLSAFPKHGAFELRIHRVDLSGLHRPPSDIWRRADSRRGCQAAYCSGRADAVLAAQLLDRHPSFRFIENPHDLGLRKARLLHREPPVPSCQKALLLDGVFSGETYGGYPSSLQFRTFILSVQ